MPIARRENEYIMCHLSRAYATASADPDLVERNSLP
jgi:hypothetical protein